MTFIHIAQLIFTICAAAFFSPSLAVAQDLKVGDVSLSWTQNYESAFPLAITWKSEKEIHEGYSKQTVSGQNGTVRPKKVALSSRFWHHVGISNESFQHRKCRAESFEQAQSPTSFEAYPLTEKQVESWNEMDVYRSEFSSFQNGEFVRWVYAPHRDLHVFDAEEEPRSADLAKKKGLLVSSSHGLEFELPTQKYLTDKKGVATFTDTDDGNLRLEIDVINNQLEASVLGTRVSWVLDTSKSLLPLSFERFDYQRKDGVENGIVSQVGKFSIAGFGNGWYVDSSEIDIFNYVKIEGEMVRVKTQTERFEVLNISKMEDTSLLTMDSPEDAIAFSSGEIDLDENLKAKIEEVGLEDAPVPNPWKSYLLTGLLCSIFAVAFFFLIRSRR